MSTKTAVLQLNNNTSAHCSFALQNCWTGVCEAGGVSASTKTAKHNTQWRKQFMEFERQLAYSFREGKAEGKVETKKEVVVEFLKKGISPELIAECVKLPLEKVLELQEKTHVNV